VISVHDRRCGDAVGDLAGFRREFYGCLTRPADALFELTDAVLYADGRVRSLVELPLVGEHRRGHHTYASAFHGLRHVDVRRWLIVLGCGFQVVACLWCRVSPRWAPFSRRVGWGRSDGWCGVQVGAGSANRRPKIAWMWPVQGHAAGKFSRRLRPPRVRVAGV
jgi:hypothetical protein